jgi:hypothetical protein
MTGGGAPVRLKKIRDSQKPDLSDEKEILMLKMHQFMSIFAKNSLMLQRPKYLIFIALMVKNCTHLIPHL